MDPNKKSKYWQHMEQKSQLFMKEKLRRFLKTALILFFIAALVAGIGWLLKFRHPLQNQEIISVNGIHWHPELEIFIKGQKQEIPANIGLGITENPIHTHDATGILHLEFGGVVTKENIKLGNFFKVWEKIFNKDCVFTYCNGPDGKLKMTVNGKESDKFENYEMRDKDKIEIRYQ